MRKIEENRKKDERADLFEKGLGIKEIGQRVCRNQGKNDCPGLVMVSDTICPTVHIFGKLQKETLENAEYLKLIAPNPTPPQPLCLGLLG